jgi:hypothetical protein
MSAERPGKPTESDANRGRFATGREIYARLAREGAPDDRTLRGLKQTRQARIRVADALATKPASGSERP